MCTYIYIWSYLFSVFELKFSARQLALQVRLSQGLDHIEQESRSQGLMICYISLFITVCIQRCAVTCWLMRIEQYGPIGQPGNVQRWVGLGPQCSCDGVFSNLRSASWRNHIRKSEKSLHHFFVFFLWTTWTCGSWPFSMQLGSGEPKPDPNFDDVTETRWLKEEGNET